MNCAQLTHELSDLLQRGRYLDADFLFHLAEFGRRRLFIESGHTSLWDFCTRKLGLEKGATFRRVTCVEILNRHPPAIDYLRDGRISMTAIVLLKDVLTAENASEWLERSAGQSCEDIECMVGGVRPRAERRDGLRKLPSPSPAPPSAVNPASAQLFTPTAAFPAQREPGREQEREPKPEQKPEQDRKPERKPEPARERYQFTATGDHELKALYQKARALLSHKIPRDDPAAILKLALAAIIEKEEKRRGLRRTPRRQAQKPAAPGHITAAVTREVWRRDGGRCSWMMPDGSTCRATWQLERDHRIPKARGGGSTTEGVRLLCRVHNQQAAREVFGDVRIDRFASGSVNGTRGAGLAGTEARAQPRPNQRMNRFYEDDR